MIYFMIYYYILVLIKRSQGGKIYDQLQRKLDAMIRHELYSKSKTAPTKEEQKEARLKYLDMVGIPKDFRW